MHRVSVSSSELLLPMEQLCTRFNVELKEEITLSFLSQSVRLRTNSFIARRWTGLYLTPYCTLTVEQPGSEYFALFLSSKTAIDILPPGQNPVPIDLHYGKKGLRWDDSTGRMFIRELERGDWYIIDRLASQVLYITSASVPDTYRDSARIIREIMLSMLIGQGYLPLHGSVAALNGEAITFVGEKQSGKTTLLMHLIDSYSADYISNDKFLVRADEHGELTVYGFPLSCRLGFGTMRAIDSLAKHLHLFEHIEAGTVPIEELWGEQEKLEFTPREMSSIIGCSLKTVAPLRAIVFPQFHPLSQSTQVRTLNLVENQSRLQEMLLYPDANFLRWLDIGMSDIAAWTSEMECTWNALLHIPAYSLVGGKNGIDLVRTLVGQMQADKYFDRTPTTPQPQQWLRPPIKAQFVAILNHRREQRGMFLTSWQTRVLHTGDIHEFVATPDGVDSPEARIDEVYYLGFAECSAGIIAVGDIVSTDTEELGSVLGFDETHAPNHLNILLRSHKRQTGLQLGLQPGDYFSIHRAGTTVGRIIKDE